MDFGSERDLTINVTSYSLGSHAYRMNVPKITFLHLYRSALQS